MAGRYVIEDDTPSEPTSKTEGRFIVEDDTSFMGRVKDFAGPIAEKLSRPSQPPPSLNPRPLSQPDFEQAPVAAQRPTAPVAPVQADGPLGRALMSREWVNPGAIVGAQDVNAG